MAPAAHMVRIAGGATSRTSSTTSVASTATARFQRGPGTTARLLRCWGASTTMTSGPTAAFRSIASRVPRSRIASPYATVVFPSMRAPPRMTATTTRSPGSVRIPEKISSPMNVERGGMTTSTMPPLRSSRIWWPSRS